MKKQERLREVKQFRSKVLNCIITIMAPMVKKAQSFLCMAVDQAQAGTAIFVENFEPLNRKGSGRRSGAFFRKYLAIRPSETYNRFSDGLPVFADCI
jgi:hypothetical protein